MGANMDARVRIETRKLPRGLRVVPDLQSATIEIQEAILVLAAVAVDVDRAVGRLEDAALESPLIVRLVRLDHLRIPVELDDQEVILRHFDEVRLDRDAVRADGQLRRLADPGAPRVGAPP